MSKSTSRHQRKKSGGTSQRKERASDRTIYLGLIIIGLAVVGFFFLVLDPSEKKGQYLSLVALGYVVAMAWLTHVYAFAACRGSSLAGWKQALARIPLRLAGYGTKHGRPLEAAHGSDHARKAIIVSAIVSLIILAGLTVWLVRGVLG